MISAPAGTGLAPKRSVTAVHRDVRVAFAFALLPLLAIGACSTTPAGPHVASLPAAAAGEDMAQPALAAYSCADGETMTIRNVGTAIRLIGSNGMEEELPASPVNQRSRYGEAHDAIVLDGREALVMRGGKTPITCTR